MSIFKGAAVAIITPMTETQEVNYEKLGELIEEQIAGGTDAIVICGTTGEASTLSHEEHLDAIKYTVEKVNHRIPVIAGTGSNSTETAIYLSQEAEKYGVDGLLLVSPYYNKATQKGLIAHFTAIADSVKVPVILYNFQGRTGVNIAPETIVYLFNNVENIVAVKEASGNISQVAKIMQLTDGKIDLYSGNDDQVVPIAVRYPRGEAYTGLKEFRAPICLGKSEVIHEGSRVALLAVGSMVKMAEEVQKQLKERMDMDAALVNARFVKPIDEELLRSFADTYELVVTLEENVKDGGFGERVLAFAEEEDLPFGVEIIALPDRFIPHGSVSYQMKQVGFTPEDICGRIEEYYRKQGQEER